MKPSPKNSSFTAKYLCLTLIALCLSWQTCFSASVDSDQAEQIARNWMTSFAQPLESEMSNVIEKVETINDQAAGTLYHVVTLAPEGYLIVPGDDRLGDVIAFSANGYYDDSVDNPLSVMVQKDMVVLIEAIESIPVPVKKPATGEMQVNGVGSGLISDLRVEPLLQSEWNQGDVLGSECYNYYTPNNYPVGCVATAMAQVMRYHTYPDFGIGVHQYDIEIDGTTSTSYQTRGGNGSGGPYNWSDMPLEPALGVTSTERQAIGALCYDAGLSVNMSYTASSSGATTYAASNSLKALFGFDNSVHGWNYGSNMPTSLLINMINPNLDAGYPVILGISRPTGGHAVVADGYGYIGSTLYHHVNLGWGGSSDAWYALPTIDTTSYVYTSVDDCSYNIFVDETGEIISGRVLDQGGNPISGVTVEAKYSGSVVTSDISDSRGVYALKGVQSDRTYTVHAVLAPYVFNDQFATTGTSQNNSNNCGNVWGIDLISTSATPPTALDQTTDSQSGEIIDVTLQAYDEGLPNPPASLTYIISELPEYGHLLDPNFPNSDPNGVPIEYVPYALTGNNVKYQSCPTFSGTDNFNFKANDGGSAPQAGDSTPAEVTVNVSNDFVVTYNPAGNYVSDFIIDTTFKASRFQIIYHANEVVGDVSGPRQLTSIAMEMYQASPVTLNNWTIRMKHTTKSSYPGFENYDNTGLQVVYQANQNLPVGWQEFLFQSPFEYNGTDNLLIDVSFENFTTSATAGRYHIHNTPNNRIIGTFSNTVPNPLTWSFYDIGSYYLSKSLPYMKFGQEIIGSSLPGDCNRDCRVTLKDVAAVADAWLSISGQSHYNSQCDMAPAIRDNIVNILDLKVIAENWLQSSFD